jgi:hypothetical protein
LYQFHRVFGRAGGSVAESKPESGLILREPVFLAFDAPWTATYGCPTSLFINIHIAVGETGMRRVTINGKPVGAQPARQVISRSAILILSGILIGTTLSQGNLTGLSFSGFCAGVIGMISFYGLDVAARRREDRVVRRRLAVVDLTLATRLKRHVSSHAVPPRRMARSAADASYLPVAFAGAR